MSEVMGPWDKMTPEKALQEINFLYKKDGVWGFADVELLKFDGGPSLFSGIRGLGTKPNEKVDLFKFEDCNMIHRWFDFNRQLDYTGYYIVQDTRGEIDKHWRKL